MNNKRMLWMVPLLALVAGWWGGPRVGPQLDLEASNVGHEMRAASLVGSSAFPNARGQASFQTQDDKVFKIAVENAAAAANSAIDIFVDGAKVGSLWLDEMGTGNLAYKMVTSKNLTIEAANSFKVIAPFPPLRGGSLVEIRTAAGLVIVSGTVG